MDKENSLATLKAGNLLLRTTVDSKKVFSLGRLGSVEAGVVQLMESGARPELRNRKLAWINAGIAFSTLAELNRFTNVYTQSLGEVDLIATWPLENIPNQT